MSIETMSDNVSYKLTLENVLDSFKGSPLFSKGLIAGYQFLLIFLYW